jgi:hypothetical protein
MINKFDDVRNTVFSKQSNVVDVNSDEILKTLSFNEATRWKDELAPQKFLEYGKIPPLGIKGIHKEGVTGKKVNVAIIDQPLALDHPEYRGKIVEYKTFFPPKYDIGISSMHGPAVTSLLVGENIGVAPNARVYYAAVPSWLGDAIYEVQALKWIIEINEELSENDKIKFVSVSAAPGVEEAREKNSHLWNETVKEAEEKGICVVDCNGFVYPGFVEYDTNNFHYGFPNNEFERRPLRNVVCVPNSLRTVAESYDNKIFSYAYWGVGGLSWGIPYAVGVLCLAQEINNELSAVQLRDMLIKNASDNKGIINPKSFLNNIKKAARR